MRLLPNNPHAAITASCLIVMFEALINKKERKNTGLWWVIQDFIRQMALKMVFMRINGAINMLLKSIVSLPGLSLPIFKHSEAFLQQFSIFAVSYNT
jgi:hypothetical protein